MLGEFDYVRARSVGEACRLLEEEEDAEVLAGGTDLLVAIRNRTRTPRLLVDIKGIEELGGLDANDSEVVIGAVVPLNVVAEHRRIRDALPSLAEAAVSIGTYQIRNRATLAGNLCNASPAADSAPALLTAGARVSIAGPRGARTIPVSELFTGVKRTCLLAGELVTDIRVPASHGERRTAFAKQQRIRGHDLAIVNAAGTYEPATGYLRIAIGSCAPTPILLESIDVKRRCASLVDHVTQLAVAAVSPIDDVRASAEYRRAVLPAMLRRLIEQLLDKGGSP